jgi:predicted lipoprotein
VFKNWKNWKASKASKKRTTIQGLHVFTFFIFHGGIPQTGSATNHTRDHVSAAFSQKAT